MKSSGNVFACIGFDPAGFSRTYSDLGAEN